MTVPPTPQAGGPARLRGRGRGKRITFREAVPVRRDRRGLRRQFRRATRDARDEWKTGMTALLRQLSASRMPLSEVLPGPRARDGVLLFLDGTQLLLTTRHGSADIKHLRQARHGFSSSVAVWLVRAEPSFTRRWFRLWFATDSHASLVEIHATVMPPAAAGHRGSPPGRRP